jgi:hypothetical protein
VRTYIEEESEMASVMAAKLGSYFQALPREVELFSDVNQLS